MPWRSCHIKSTALHADNSDENQQNYQAFRSVKIVILFIVLIRRHRDLPKIGKPLSSHNGVIVIMG